MGAENTRAEHDDAAHALTIVADAEVSAAESLEERRRHSVQRLANAAWERATPADASHGYLQRKGIGPQTLLQEHITALLAEMADRFAGRTDSI
jgi:hypothetical protein